MKKDRILSIGILLVCLIMFMETFDFPEKTSVQVVGPAAYPRFLLYIIAGFSMIIFIKSFFSKKTEEDQATKFNLKEFWDHYKNIILLFLFFGVYVYLLSTIGFIISTLLFMFASQALLMGLKKREPIVTNICVATVATFLIYFVFTDVLSIILP